MFKDKYSEGKRKYECSFKSKKVWKKGSLLHSKACHMPQGVYNGRNQTQHLLSTLLEQNTSFYILNLVCIVLL